MPSGSRRGRLQEITVDQNLVAGDDESAAEFDADDLDVLKLMQHLRKKKDARKTAQTSDLAKLASPVVTEARTRAKELVEEGSQYMERCRSRVAELRESETDAQKEVAQLWSTHEQSVQSLVANLTKIVDELSPRRAKDINSASELLELQASEREESCRKAMKMAKKSLNTSFENQKLATEASALIKHYKALLTG